jgi:2-polyprenyl-3-methyl-5-hydroxy-6-metoxy-1,4-benzoquinol methylase
MGSSSWTRSSADFGVCAQHLVKTLSFSSQEIRTNGVSGAAWHSFVRRREFEMVATCFPRGTFFDEALELGAGDGGQSEVIAPYCRHLTCTELLANNEAVGRFQARNLPNVSYELCDARDLSRFEDRSFDFIFSSNMLEHVEGVGRCLGECRRVLCNGGMMVHTMPSRVWKIWNSAVSLGLRRVKPPIHGTSRSHLAEFRDFGVARWQREFASCGFKVYRMVGLPFYFGHGPRPQKLLLAGNKLGWKSSVAYFCRPDAS